MDSNVETVLIGDLEVLSLDTNEDQRASMNWDPLSYHEAMESPDADKWKAATLEEWGALLNNDTFQAFNEPEVAPHLDQRQPSTIDPKDLTPMEALDMVKVISSKWVYKKKINPDGSTRYSVQLIIRGFEKVAGMHFGETYAPVSKLTTFRLLMSLAARYSWRVDHMDVATAFLNPKIEHEAVYMSLLAGMEWIDPGLYGCGVEAVRLRKALYGLQQAPKLWFDDINRLLLSLGFKASSANSNLYIRGSVIILLYVDDILVIDTKTGSKLGQMVRNLLYTKYIMTSLGIARRFLGIEIACTDQGIALSQERYINAILRRFGMMDPDEAKSPMDPNVHLDNMLCEDKTAD
jgi:hypothetical protein